MCPLRRSGKPRAWNKALLKETRLQEGVIWSTSQWPNMRGLPAHMEFFPQGRAEGFPSALPVTGHAGQTEYPPFRHIWESWSLEKPGAPLAESSPGGCFLSAAFAQ